MNTPGSKRQMSRELRQLWAKVNVPIRARFSILSLLIFVTIVSIWLAKISSDAREQKAAVKFVELNEGSVAFDINLSVPDWLRNAVGEEYFRTLKQVKFASNNGRKSGSKESKATDANLKHLESLSILEQLDLGNNRNVTDAGLVHLRALKNLTSLHLYRTGVRGPGLVHISDLPKLELLVLLRTDLQDSGLKHLGTMPSLTQAYLDNTKVTDAGMPDLARATTLKKLTLKSTDITDAGLMHLAKLKRLESLNLVGTYVTAQGVARFKQTIPDCRVDVSYGLGKTPSEELLFPEAYQPTLNEINTKLRQLGIHSEVQTYYSRPDNPIATLRLHNSTMSDKVLLSLVEKIPDLKRIFLHHALVGDEFLKGICRKKIRALRLESTRVTDEGLRYLSQLPKLERLVLMETNVTDKGFIYLHSLSNLESIELHDNTRVTSKGIRQLRHALPNCVVIGVPVHED